MATPLKVGDTVTVNSALHKGKDAVVIATYNSGRLVRVRTDDNHTVEGLAHYFPRKAK